MRQRAARPTTPPFASVVVTRPLHGLNLRCSTGSKVRKRFTINVMLAADHGGHGAATRRKSMGLFSDRFSDQANNGRNEDSCSWRDQPKVVCSIRLARPIWRCTARIPATR